MTHNDGAAQQAAAKTQPLEASHSFTMTSTESKTVITLKGSVEIVSEFFFTAINSILYQRGKSRKHEKHTVSID